MTTDTDPDDALVRAIAQGDTGALARAFDRYAATLTRYAWAIAADRSDVEEIVQDAFLTLWQRPGPSNCPRTRCSRGCSWCAGTTPGTPCGSVTGTGRTSSPSTSRRQESDRGRRDAAVGPRGDRRAPETDRRICELCLLEGHSYAEAAALLGLSTGRSPSGSPATDDDWKAVMHDEH